MNYVYEYRMDTAGMYHRTSYPSILVITVTSNSADNNGGKQ